MNGGQDLGGMQGFGPVRDDTDIPHFHAEWEKRVMAMVVALGAAGKWNIDQSRHARESLNPADYLAFTYYHIWLEGVTRLLVEREMISPAELAGGAVEPAMPVRAVWAKDDVWPALHSLKGAADRTPTRPARFKVGDNVITINAHPQTHTRLPRYARGKSGEITKVIGCHVYPDASGNGLGENPHWLYQVTFTANELWGADANPRDRVTLDLWEPYFV